MHCCISKATRQLEFRIGDQGINNVLIIRWCISVRIDVSEVLIKFHDSGSLKFTRHHITEGCPDGDFIPEFPERAAQARSNIPTKTEWMHSGVRRPWRCESRPLDRQCLLQDTPRATQKTEKASR